MGCFRVWVLGFGQDLPEVEEAEELAEIDRVAPARRQPFQPHETDSYQKACFIWLKRLAHLLVGNKFPPKTRVLVGNSFAMQKEGGRCVRTVS